MKTPYMIAALVAISLTGCDLLKKATPAAPATDRLVEATDAQAAELVRGDMLSGEWIITDASGRQIKSSDDRNITLTFKISDNGAGEMYCFTGCNYLNGDVVVNVKNNTVEPKGSFMASMMACDDNATANEQAVAKAVNAMHSFAIEHVGNSYTLNIKDKAGETVLTGRRWDTAFLNGAWEVSAIGDSNIDPSAEVQLVLDIPEGRLHGNTGCNIVNGMLRETADRINGIEFSNLAVTRRACPEPQTKVERELLVALENVAECRSASDGETAELLDSDGKTLIKLRRLVLQRRNAE